MSPSQQDMQKLEALYNSRKYHDLELETKKLIKEYSNIATLYNILGIALQKKGDFQEAINLNSTHIRLGTFLFGNRK